MRFCWVMLAEALSMAESSRAIAALHVEGIRVNDILVNRLTPPPPSRCTLCDGRRRVEAQWLNAISARWGDQAIRLWTLPAWQEPLQGVEALRAVARRVSALKRAAMRQSPERIASHAETATPPRHPLPAPLRPSRSTRLLIVGGKGGVGKSTCAATLAVAVARASPDRKVLLVSTDPAHSLGDVIGQKIGPLDCRIRGAPGNLMAREIDAARDWRERRERYRESVARVFKIDGPGSNVNLTLDHQILDQLLELAPPGMDEVVGILTVIDALEERIDLVIVDSAPTGHTLRLLALPAQAQRWVRQLMALVLKYRAVAAFERVASELVWLSRGLRRLQAILVNPRQCGFVVVTRPEQLPALETLRLIDWLSRHRIARRALIANGITPPGCARCRRTAARERRRLATLTSAPPYKRAGCPIIVTDAIAPPPRGVASLGEWQRTWRLAARRGLKRVTE
jgi:arsenite-transporting ATPase